MIISNRSNFLTNWQFPLLVVTQGGSVLCIFTGNIFFQNKDYIYRGLDFEKLPSFTQRISDEFPTATILATNSPPDDVIRSQAGQAVQICCVKPVVKNSIVGPDLTQESLGFAMPERVKESKGRLEISQFRFDRPFHKDEKSDKNEFKVSDMSG